MNHTKHLLIMLACCLVPLALILTISVFGVSLGALQPLVPFALALMCPLMMLMMMRGMRHDHSAQQPIPTNAQGSKEITSRQ